MTAQDLTLQVTVTGNEGSELVQARAGTTQVVDRVDLDSVRRSFLEIFDDWLGQGKITRRRELEVFGTVLFRTLFGGNVGALLSDMLARATPPDRVRLQFSFANKPELAGLPWEYLYYDTGLRPGFFAATSPELVLSRYIEVDHVSTPPLPERELRVLAAISQPSDLPAIPTEPIVALLRELEGRYPLSVTTLANPTLEELFDGLQRAPHVVYFLGHGRFVADGGEGSIALSAPNGRGAAWLDGRILGDVFSQTRSRPRLIMLHTFAGNPATLANRLLWSGVQALLVVQYPISVNDAAAFGRAFFRELLHGRAIDLAVQVARWRMTTGDPSAYDRAAFGAPTLFAAHDEPLLLAAAPGTASAP